MQNNHAELQKKRMSKKYIFENKENENNLYGYIDCYEKILCCALEEHTENCKKVFCNDINLKICIEQLGFYPNDLKLKDELFQVKRYTPIPQQAMRVLENLIDKGTIVAVCTMFDMLPPFEWYQQKDKIGKSNTHFTIVVGYDKNYVYFAEHPDMLKRDAVMWSENPTVGMIEKKYLKNAFEKYCEILTVEVNDEKAKNFDKLTIIKNEIVNNYYFHDVEEAEGYHFVIGRQALIALLTLLESDKVLEKIVSNYFWIYMMARRRMLLEQCLNEERDLYKNVNKVCRLLRASSDEWMTLYYRISAYYRGAGTAERTKMYLSERIKKIIKLEEDLIQMLATVRIGQN